MRLGHENLAKFGIYGVLESPPDKAYSVLSVDYRKRKGYSIEKSSWRRVFDNEASSAIRRELSNSGRSI
jgi:hypothetical protein